MKKIFIAIMAVAAAVSCSQEMTLETPKGAAIAFDNAFVENATRADLTAENLKDFGVYGSVVNSQNQEGMIFKNQTVSGNSVDGYTYSSVQYWIANAQYYFVALAPVADAHWAYAPTVETAAQNGTITFNNADAAGEQDFLYAYKKPAKTEETITSQPEKVKFTFNHMLSRVKFQFTNGFGEGQNITLKVTNVTITDAHSVGTLAVTEGAVADNWEVTSETFTRPFGNLPADLVENGGNGETAHYYLIPTKATYNVAFNVELFQAGISVDTYSRTAVLNLDMKKGHSYIVKATLNQDNTSDDGALYPIEFAVEGVEDWKDYTDVEAEVVEPVQVATAKELVEAVAAGKSVVLTEDINLGDGTRALGYGLDIVANSTFDGNGHTLTCNAVRAINIAETAKVVAIRNLNIIAGGERGINAEGADKHVTIENVTAVSKNYTVNLVGSTVNNVVEINNCDLKGLNVVNVWGANSKVTVNNTTLRCEDNNASEGYGVVAVNNMAEGAEVVVNDGEVIITGTACEDTVAGILVANGGASLAFVGTAGNPVVEGQSYLIRYGDYNYTFATWEEAYEAAQAGETIVLTKDVTLAAPIQFKKKLTLDLNGKTLKSTADDQDAICVLTDGDLTIVGEGNVVSEESYSVYVGGTGKLTINGGNYESVISAVYAQKHAQVVINGGTFKSNDYTNSQGDSYGQTYTLNLRDKKNNPDDTATITVYGGSFYKFNPAQSLSENPQANFVAAGKTVEQEGDWYIVK